jgi:hypothetical protein
MADMRLSSSQLMTIDAARISSIVEEALEKLSFLASITPDVMAHRDELSQIVGDEITRIISEQRALEMQYETLVAQRNALKAQSNKAKVEENQLAIREVARALRESTKELTRNLKGNPNIAENLSKIQAERSSLQNLLSKTLRELRESSFSTLTTTVNEEKLRTDMLLEVRACQPRRTPASFWGLAFPPSHSPTSRLRRASRADQRSRALLTPRPSPGSHRATAGR